MSNENTTTTEQPAPAAVRSSDLLACPFCGEKPTVTAMRYINTGRIYGYRLTCGGCGVEIIEKPDGWVCGKENETMMEAKAALENRWNMRAPGRVVSRRTAYLRAIASRLDQQRTRVPSEAGHPIITRQWLYDLNKTLLQCSEGLKNESAG